MRGTIRALSALLLGIVGSAHATDAVPWSEEEFESKIRAAQVVSPLTSELFGEHVSLYDGSTSFQVTDVDLPGNNALPVRVARTFKVQDRVNEGFLKGFSDWEIEVPRLYGVFGAQGWVVEGSNPKARCSVPAKPDVAYPGLIINSWDIWSGYFLHVPGQSDQEMLVANGTSKLPAIADGKTYPWVTAGFYRLRCLPPVGSSGEYFVAISPEGTEYTFNYEVSTPTNYVKVGQVNSKDSSNAGRQRISLLATHVQDRFGNFVDYHYSGDHLTGITGSDGRAIALTWTGDVVTSITANGRTWTYAYTPVTGFEYPSTLTTVTQPDGSSWGYSATGTLKTTREPPVDGGANTSCPTESDPRNATSYRFTVTSPSGARGDFDFWYTRFRRSHTPIKQCKLGPSLQAPIPYAAHYWDGFALVGKTVSGPGMATQSWGYNVAPGSLYFYQTGTATDPCPDCPATKQTVVTKPDGTYDRYTFGIMYGINDGQLLKVEHGAGTAAPISTTSTDYVTNDEVPAQRFPSMAGSSLLLPYSIGNHFLPVKKTTVVQDGGTFQSAVTVNGSGTYSFDAFARSTQVQKSGTATKVDNTQYADDLVNWVLGLVTKQWLGSDLPYAQYTYDANDQVATISKFGKLQNTLTYNPDGTLKTLSDGRDSSGFDTTIALSNWYRGIPQDVKYPATPEAPTGAAESAVVDANGWITSVTDEVNNSTSYAYDGMGRLTTITYPSGDSPAWSVTSLAFAPVTGSEFGIAPGHWRQTISTGNSRKVTYYDGLWRPVLVREYDAANPAGTDRYTAASYELGGQQEFASYPVAVAPLMDRGYWVTSVGSTAPTTSAIPGTHTFYDAIDRVTKVQADSELGVLTTTRAYLHNTSGNYTLVTDPNLNKTYSWSQAFEQPSDDAPISIWHPEGAYTDISRDLYGKPTAITRRDASRNVTETRSYAYDANQRLCRTDEPESGATLMGYDQVGDLLWSAAGLPAGTPCDSSGTTSAVLDRKATRSYDARRHLQTLTFADGQSDTSYTYFADGALASVTALNGGTDSVTTSYSYNKRRLLTSERMQWNAVNWGIGYGYDAIGNLATVTYPSGINVNYVPNALGQPTRAGSYATGVTYWPNGGMKQFTYGNGIVHTLDQNDRGLPERSLDKKSGVAAVLDDSYDYDANGNVLGISDGRPGNRGNRDMTYDGLNRLKTASSPMFNGTVATYTYDVLDNLRTVKAPGRDQTYLYDPSTWQLTNVTDNTQNGATVIGLKFDLQGNLANKNGTLFSFDYGNRLRGVSGTAASSYVYDGLGRRVRDYTTASKYSLYSKAGQLLYDNNGRTGVSTSYIYLNGSLVAQDSNTASLGTPVLTAPTSDDTSAYTVSWNALSAANRYDLQEQFNGGAWVLSYSDSGTSRDFTGKALGSWSYRVRGCADAVCGNWSDVATVTESAPTPPPSAAPALTVPSTALNGSYSISWASVSGATTYTLEESANGGVWIGAYTGPALGADFAGKTAGSHAYRVKACNSTGCSPVSATGTVQVIYPPASSPTLTVPATSYNGSYTVSWSAVATSTSYTLEESVNNGTWSTPYTGGALSKAFASVAAGSHAYRVMACNAAGCSDTSAVSTVQVTYPPAAAPTVTTPATNGTGAYTVSWSAVSSATSYTLEESANAGAWTLLQSGAARSRATSGKGDGSYAYRAKACNVAGCSPVSASATTVVNIPAPASAPTLQVPPSPSAGSAYTVTWGTVALATSYQLDELTTVWANVYNGAGGSASFTRAVGTYGYRVRACNAKGCGPYSATQYASPERGCTTCLLPSGSTAPLPRKATTRKGGK